MKTGVAAGRIDRCSNPVIHTLQFRSTSDSQTRRWCNCQCAHLHQNLLKAYLPASTIGMFAAISRLINKSKRRST